MWEQYKIDDRLLRLYVAASYIYDKTGEWVEELDEESYELLCDRFVERFDKIQHPSKCLYLDLDKLKNYDCTGFKPIGFTKYFIEKRYGVDVDVC